MVDQISHGTFMEISNINMMIYDLFREEGIICYNSKERQEIPRITEWHTKELIERLQILHSVISLPISG